MICTPSPTRSAFAATKEASRSIGSRFLDQRVDSEMLLSAAAPDASPHPPGPIIRGPQNMGVQQVSTAASSQPCAPAWSTRCLASTEARTELREEDPAAVRLPRRSFKRSPAPTLSPVLSDRASNPSTPAPGMPHVPPVPSVVSVMQERMMPPPSPRSSRTMSSPRSERMIAEKVAAQLAAAQPAAPPTTLAPPISCSTTPGVPTRSCNRRTSGGSWSSGGHNLLAADLASRTRSRREHDDEPRSARSSATTDSAQADLANGMNPSFHDNPWLMCLVVGMHRLLGCDLPER